MRSFFISTTLFVSLIFANQINCQSSLLQDSLFLSNQVKEYEFWMHSAGLDEFLRITSSNIEADKFTLFLGPSDNIEDCELFQSYWDSYKDTFNVMHRFKQTFSEMLLSTLAYLTSINYDSLSIIISCDNPHIFQGSINVDKIGRVLLTEDRIEKQGNGRITLLSDKLKTVKSGERIDRLSTRKKCSFIRRLIGEYLVDNWYKGKGKLHHHFKVDTILIAYDRFNWGISHLSNEVLKGEKLFEYHNIDVEIQDRGGMIDINWKFTGYYASGIFFPPKRKEFYKQMVTNPRFRHLEDSYQLKLFTLIEEFLIQSLGYE